MRKFWIFLFFLLAGCASGPTHSLNGRIEKNFFKVKIDSKAQFGLLRQLRKGVSCSSVTPEDLEVVVINDLTGEKVEKTYDCKQFDGFVWVRTKEFQKSGSYRLEIVKKEDRKKFQGDRFIRTKFEDSEFASEGDQAPLGALELTQSEGGKGGSVSSKVSYNSGDRTDWIRVSGDSGLVSLGFSHFQKNSKSLYATVFRAKKNSANVKLIGSIKPEKTKTFRLNGATDLYVRIRSYLYRDGGEYVLKRREIKKIEKKKSRTVAIVDCFPVSGNTSMALISQPQGLKVGDEIDLLGKTKDEKTEFLGKCQVASVFEDQANCQLPKVLKKSYSAFVGKINL